MTNTQFTDNKQRVWDCSLTVGALDDIKKHAGFELDELMKNPEAFAEMITANPRKLVAVMFGICAEQCKEQGIDATEFGRAFTRDTLENAANALVYAVVDFFPRRSVAQVLTEKLPKMLADMDKQLSEATRAALSRNVT